MFLCHTRLVTGNFKKQVMKRMVFALTVLVLPLCTAACQKNGIDNFFNSYQGKEGFTTVNLSGDLFSLIADTSDDEKSGEISMDISSVRILSINEDNNTGGINFMEELKRSINRGGYEELMMVKNSKNDVRVLIKSSGRKVKELLVISGGKDNALIQIKGNFEKKDIRKLADSNIESLRCLDSLEEDGN